MCWIVPLRGRATVLLAAGAGGGGNVGVRAAGTYLDPIVVTVNIEAY
jgi:hypothetical protein